MLLDLFVVHSDLPPLLLLLSSSVSNGHVWSRFFGNLSSAQSDHYRFVGRWLDIVRYSMAKNISRLGDNMTARFSASLFPVHSRIRKPFGAFRANIFAEDLLVHFSCNFKHFQNNPKLFLSSNHPPPTSALRTSTRHCYHQCFS